MKTDPGTRKTSFRPVISFSKDDALMVRIEKRREMANAKRAIERECPGTEWDPAEEPDARAMPDRARDARDGFQRSSRRYPAERTRCVRAKMRVLSRCRDIYPGAENEDLQRTENTHSENPARRPEDLNVEIDRNAAVESSQANEVQTAKRRARCASNHEIDIHVRPVRCRPRPE